MGQRTETERQPRLRRCYFGGDGRERVGITLEGERKVVESIHMLGGEILFCWRWAEGKVFGMRYICVGSKVRGKERKGKDLWQSEVSESILGEKERKESIIDVGHYI